MKKGHDAGTGALKKYTKRPPKRRKFRNADSIMTLKGDDEVKNVVSHVHTLRGCKEKALSSKILQLKILAWSWIHQLSKMLAWSQRDRAVS